jgi:group I intron endonuclease
MGCVYKLTSPSGKSYVGMTSLTLNRRWAKHVEHALGKRENGYLYAALRKYGPDEFVREILLESDDKAELSNLEIKMIAEHGTLWPTGYNLTTGGEYPANRIYNERARRNISEAQKRRFADPDQREKNKANFRKGTEVRRQKCSEIRKTKKAEKAAWLASDERKDVQSKAIKAAMARPEVREKVQCEARKRAASPEWRRRISNSKRGKKLPAQTSEHKQRIAEARRREWADPVIRERRLLALEMARKAKAAKG